MAEEKSFMDMVDERMMNPPADAVEKEETSEMESPEKEIMEEEQEETPELDMVSLFQTVYSEEYNPEDPKSAGKMRLMKESMEKDERVMQMAKESPEKFALFMYGRTSAIS